MSLGTRTYTESSSSIKQKEKSRHLQGIKKDENWMRKLEEDTLSSFWWLIAHKKYLYFYQKCRELLKNLSCFKQFTEWPHRYAYIIKCMSLATQMSLPFVSSITKSLANRSLSLALSFLSSREILKKKSYVASIAAATLLVSQLATHSNRNTEWLTSQPASQPACLPASVASYVHAHMYKAKVCALLQHKY